MVRSNPVSVTVTSPSTATVQVGLEVWDRTTNGFQRAYSTGSDPLPIMVFVGDSVVFKQPANTSIGPGSRVDLYYGEYAQPGTYVSTAFANANGYWEIDSWLSGVPATEAGTGKRYFVYVNNQTYSYGIRVNVT